LTEGSQRELDYDDVYNQTGSTNCTVYCGGIQNNLTGMPMLAVCPTTWHHLLYRVCSTTACVFHQVYPNGE